LQDPANVLLRAKALARALVPVPNHGRDQGGFALDLPINLTGRRSHTRAGSKDKTGILPK
jgi:hypothetical protein